MKLALAIFHYFPYGGLQRDMAHLAQLATQAGHQVHVLCMGWQGPELPGCQHHIHPGRGSSRLARQRDFADFVRAWRETQSADVLLGFNRMPGLDCYFAGDSCFAAKAAARGWLYGLAPRTRHYLAWERAVCAGERGPSLLFISELQQQEYLGHYPAAAARARLLPPGIDPSRRAPPAAEAAGWRQELRRELGLGTEDWLLLQVGSGFAIKGVDRALRALAALPVDLKRRCHYVLAGQGRQGPYRRLSRRLGLAHRVHLLGARDDVPQLMQAADLLLHPAYQESAGLSLLEGLAAGLPVLTTDTCGHAWHVQQAEAGLVCDSPFQQQALVHKLEAMLQPARLAQYRAAALAYAGAVDLYGLHASLLAHLEQIHGH